ncbi:restriction endonuclease subunit S [Chryseolinea sp. H1M3-3]|uniref:restriction endonuclease subunit S n=1 Tax=Chryseolinea sp. H1M3-3 TaxID=3034144 RepID=UPI0023EB0F93|nr:restriction endonuclease subunit S [Chryseolinea sp. H1M3-3]
MGLENGFKQTDVGNIPIDWQVKILGECLFRNPNYGLNAAATSFKNSLPTYLRITDISEDGKFLKSDKVSVDHPLSKFYYLEEGDLVFARTGASVGKTYLYDKNDGELVFAGFLIRVQANKNILDSNYLKFWTQTNIYSNWIRANSMRSGQPGINGMEYKMLPIPVPPTKAEQTAIATALSDTDALITSLEKLIAKKRNIKQGAMQELLNGRERLAGFSGLWKDLSLGEIGEFRNGINKGKEDFGFGFPFVNLMDVFGIPTINSKSKLGLVNSNPVDRSTYNLKRGDVLFIRSSVKPTGVGLTSLVDEDLSDTVYSGFLIRYRDFDVFDHLFKKYCFYEEGFRQKIMDASTVSANTNINQESLKRIRLSFPTEKTEQNAIAMILNDMDMEITSLEAKLEKFKKLKFGMMQNLLTGKIRLV